MPRLHPIALLCAVLCAGVPMPAHADPQFPRHETMSLEAGQSLVREIELQGGLWWQISLEQAGIDAALLVSAGAEPAVRYDSRMGGGGRDLALLEPSGTQQVRVVIEAAERGVPPGSVRLRIESHDPATASAPLIEALRAESAGNRRAGADDDHQQRARALQEFTRASAAYEEAADAVAAADARASMAALLHMQGDSGAARAAWELALAVYRREAAIPRAALAAFGSASTMLGTGHYAEADTRFGQAMEDYSASGRRLEAARARNGACLSRHLREQLDLAEDCYRLALAEFDALHAPRDRAQVLGNLGGVLYMRQRSVEAAVLFEESLRLRRAFMSESELVTARNNVALAAQRNGDYQRALDLYLENIDFARSSADPIVLGRALHNAGAVCLDLGETRRALDYLGQALAERRRTGDRAGVVSTLINLALAQRLLGAMDAARADYRAALAGAAELGLHGQQAGAEIGLARIALETGAAADALATYRGVIERMAGRENRDYLADALHGAGLAALALDAREPARDYLEQALALRDLQAWPAARTETLFALAQLAERTGDLDGAEARLAQAMTLVESTRAALLGAEQRASYLAAEFGVFEAQTRLLMRRHAADPQGGFDRRALALNERARARTLLEQIAAPSPAPGAGGVLAGVAPAYPAPLDVPAMQAALGPDATLLQFALGAERSFLWVVSARSVDAFVLPPRVHIERLARRLHAASRVNDPAGRAGADRLGAELGEMLLGRAWPLLGQSRLVIVADGALYFTPFAALRDASGSPLIARNELVHAPSVSAVAMQRRSERPGPQHMLAVLADPVYDANDERVPVASSGALPPSAPSLAAIATRRAGNGEAMRLPASGREAEAIAALVPDAERLVASGFAAQRALVVDGALAPYRIVHFATHAVVDSEDPNASGLELSRFTMQGRPVAGFLSVADLYRLQLSADLVVLSACDTALGNELRGEGIIGLSRSFLRAGAGRVLASAWQVPDRATAAFMIDIYRRLLVDHRPPPAALREAQLALLEQRDRAAPYYWAAFALNGEWL